MNRKVIHMNIAILLFLSVFFALLLAYTKGLIFGVWFPAEFRPESVSASDTLPPIKVLVKGYDEKGKWKEYLIEPFRDEDGNNFLFLPGCIDLEKVELVHTGSTYLFSPDEGRYYSAGDDITWAFQSDEINLLYEYLPKEKEYKEYRVHVMQGSDISDIFISLNTPELEDGTSPESVIDWINESKSNVTTGYMMMSNADGAWIYNGKLKKIKGRGNASFILGGDKKSLTFNLDKEAGLIDDTRKMKKWVLLNNRMDQMGLSEIYALKTYEELIEEDTFFSRCSYADVYIDGSFRGTYILAEKVDSGGVLGNDWTESDYLLEVADAGDCSFITGNGVPFTIRQPEEYTEEQASWIAGYVQEFEDAIVSETGFNTLGKYYTEYVDLQNMADFLLTYSAYGNWELMRTSTFLSVKMENGIPEGIRFGPVWDFEVADEHFGTSLFSSGLLYSTQSQCVWLSSLWQKADFLQTAAHRADRLAQIVNGYLYDEQNEMYIEKLNEDIVDSMNMNWKLYCTDEEGYEPEQIPQKMASYIGALQKRIGVWEGLWERENYLCGASIEVSKEQKTGATVLRCDAETTAKLQYQWYYDIGSGLRCLKEEKARQIIVTRPGRYYCAVTGPNNAFDDRSINEVFADESITIMCSYYVKE